MWLAQVDLPSDNENRSPYSRRALALTTKYRQTTSGTVTVTLSLLGLWHSLTHWHWQSIPVWLTTCDGRDSRRLALANLQFRRSTSPSSANGLFQFPAPTSVSLPSHVTSALCTLAIFRQHLKTFLFHLSYPDLIWFVSCFTMDLVINLLFRPH